MNKALQNSVELVKKIKASDSMRGCIRMMHNFFTERINEDCEHLFMMCIDNLVKYPEKHKGVKIVKKEGKRIDLVIEARQDSLEK